MRYFTWKVELIPNVFIDAMDAMEICMLELSKSN